MIPTDSTPHNDHAPIDREMFGSLLEWAGEIRVPDAEATGTGIIYARPEYIGEAVRSLFDRLKREDFLTGLDASRR